MASLPLVAATAASTSLNLIPDSPKLSSPSSLLPLKSPSNLHQRSSSILQPARSLEPTNLDFRERIDYGYAHLLKECIDNNSVRGVQGVHSHIIKTGTCEDLKIMTYLIKCYGKCGSLENSQKVIDKLSIKGIGAWTTLMAAYVNNSEPEGGIRVFQGILEVGFFPTRYTLWVFLSACSLLGSVELAKQIHAYMIKYKFDCKSNLGIALCTFYSKNGMLESAVKAFGRISEKDVISFTAIISACGENGDAARGLNFFCEMISEDIEPNEFTLTCVLSLCNTMLSVSVGAQVHSLVVKLGHQAKIAIKECIMYLYLNCRRIDEARKLFDGTQATMFTWNSMIVGHFQLMDRANYDLLAHLSGTEALSIFTNMKRLGLKPDVYTFSSILSVCNNMISLDHGGQIHAQTIKTGFLSDVVVGTALVNMYVKCGSMERATAAFSEMSERTLISWTNMITGFAYHGRSQQALQLFEDMRLARVRPRPNQITFVGVLWACAHAGMVDEALSYFNMMQNEYKLAPVNDHLACLIDMYLRLGQLDDAFDVVKKMKFKPSKQIWMMLIAGCRIHGNLESGCFAAEQLLKLKPKDMDSYVMSLHVYRAAGRREDVSRVQELMKDNQIRTINDWSWISIRDKVHFFTPDDHSHLHDADMNELLKDLVVKAKTRGYESLQRVEDNEHPVAVKSEVLAVAFGMLRTREGVPVRVLKSCSMSRDTHNFLEHVSVMTSRKIIIRDSKRLHIIVDGSCPCGGFGALL